MMMLLERLDERATQKANALKAAAFDRLVCALSSVPEQISFGCLGYGMNSQEIAKRAVNIIGETLEADALAYPLCIECGRRNATFADQRCDDCTKDEEHPAYWAGWHGNARDGRGILLEVLGVSIK